MSGVSVVFDPDAGVVRVGGVSLATFTGWQHPWVTPIALSRLSIHCRRAAFDEGWLDPQRTFFSLSRYPSSRKRIALFPEERPDDVGALEEVTDASSRSSFSTVFVVAMDIRMSDSLIVLGSAVSNLSTARSEIFVAAVGNSSFTLGGKFFGRLGSEGAEVELGTVQLSYCHIDFASRRPSPLPEVKRLALMEWLRPSFVAACGLDKIARLDAKMIGIQLQTSCCRFARTWPLRVADFDFNLHLNQSVYQSLTLDTLKAAAIRWITDGLHDACSSPVSLKLSQVLVNVFFEDATFDDVKKQHALRDLAMKSKLQQAVMQLDAAVGGLRIDYMKEIPLPSQDALPEIEVCLAPLLEAAENLAATKTLQVAFGVFSGNQQAKCATETTASAIPNNAKETHALGVLTIFVR